MTVTAYKTIRTLEPEAVDENDLVPVNEAARISGITPSGVSRLIDRGLLPEYRFIPKFDDTIQRLTSRAALAAYKKPIRKSKKK